MSSQSSRNAVRTLPKKGLPGLLVILFLSIAFDQACLPAEAAQLAFSGRTVQKRTAVPAATSQPVEIPPAPASPAASGKVYLPLTQNKPCVSSNPMLLSVYTQGWPGEQSTLDNEIHALDAWAGKRQSMVGTYIHIQVPNYETHVQLQLETIWNNGYTPFVNLSSVHNAYEIAIGALDDDLRQWARAYKAFATGGGGRMAFVAPLQEMNGYWVPYGRNPDNFKYAYWRIQKIFSEEGVPPESIRWTFAPNGYSDPKDPDFEAYYPGDNTVQVVAFSAYNFGYNPHNPWPRWETAAQVYTPFLDRMRAMAPTKPIIIAQTGTTGYAANGYNVEAKNQWFRDGLNYLSNYPGLLGIIYENSVNEQKYDWPFFIENDPSTQFSGYVDAVANPDICYIAPYVLKTWISTRFQSNKPLFNPQSA